MKYDLGYGKKGNGVTVYNRAEEEGGDYKTVAHIAADGKITYRDKKAPASVKAKIKKAAKEIDLKTQRGSSQMESKLTERAEKMLSDREQEIVRKSLEKATGVDVESEVGDVRYHAGNSDFAFEGGVDLMMYVGYYEGDPKPYTVSIEDMNGQQIAMEDAKDFKSVVKLAMKMAKKYKKRLTTESKLNERTFQGKEIAIYGGEDGETYIEKRGSGYYGYNNEFDFTAKNKRELEQKLRGWGYYLIAGSLDEAKLTERAEKMLSDREQEIVRKSLEKATGVDVESEVGDVRYHAGNSDFAFEGGVDLMMYVGYYEGDPKPYTVSIEDMNGQQITMQDAKDFKSIVKLATNMAKKYKKRLTTESNSEKTYIDFLNKKKGFKQDRIYFNSYEDAVKWAKANLGKFNPDVIKFEHISDTSGGTLVEATTPKQQTPEQIKAIVDKLKTNQKIQLWYDSSIKKGENWVTVVVGRKSFSKKYNVGKVTLRYADNPRASKLFFYDRDGKISLALGNMAARLIAINTSVKEGAFSKRVAKVADRKVKSAKSGNVRVKSKVWFKRGKATIGGVVYGIDGDTLTIKTKRGVVKKKKSEVAVIREGKAESINELDRMGHTGRLSRIVFYDKDEWTDRKYGTKTIGVFNAKSWGNVASTGKLYALESSDKKLVKGIKLKAGEHIFRYSTPKMLGTKEPLIKINVKKGLIYFLRDDLIGDEIAFETKSTPVVFLHLLKGKIRESINEIKFSKAQLNRLGKEYEKIKGDKLPLGASKKLKVFLSMLDKEALEQMRDAKIKFISDEAGKILKKATNESSLNEGKKSKDDVGVRLVMAINNNVDSIYELVNREKKDPKEVMSAFATPLLNSVKGVLKHNYKPHPADSSNADKLKVFIGEVKKFEKIVELLIKRPSKSGVKKLDAAWRSIWNHKGGSAIGMNGQGPFGDTIIESLNEADYKVYHKSFTGSADEARKFAEKLGFEIDEDDWQSQIGLGGRNIKSRPSVGKTHNFTVGLLKDGKPQRKSLQISVYGMKNGYELNAYIN